jgi:hypothetical protein
MSKATPDTYDDLIIGKKGEYDDYLDVINDLTERFYVAENGYYLEKALQLLGQFQAGRLNNIKKIKREDIRQLSPIEVEYVLQNLEDSFGSRIIEKSYSAYTSTPMLDLAFTLLYVIKTQKNKYLSFVDNIFIYNGKKLSIEPGEHIYSFLNAIYNLSDGMTCEISYTDLFNEMKRINPRKYNKDEEIDKNLKKYITTKKDGLFKKIKQEEFNGRALIDTVRDYGIRFNNG